MGQYLKYLPRYDPHTGLGYCSSSRFVDYTPNRTVSDHDDLQKDTTNTHTSVEKSALGAAVFIDSVVAG
jgi:hypothetical protein